MNEEVRAPMVKEEPGEGSTGNIGGLTLPALRAALPSREGWANLQIAERA